MIKKLIIFSITIERFNTRDQRSYFLIKQKKEFKRVQIQQGSFGTSIWPNFRCLPIPI